MYASSVQLYIKYRTDVGRDKWFKIFSRVWKLGTTIRHLKDFDIMKFEALVTEDLGLENKIII